MGQNGCGGRYYYTLEGVKGPGDPPIGEFFYPVPEVPVSLRIDALEQKLDRVLDHLEGRLEHVPGIGWGRLL